MKWILAFVFISVGSITQAQNGYVIGTIHIDFVDSKSMEFTVSAVQNGKTILETTCNSAEKFKMSLPAGDYQIGATNGKLNTGINGVQISKGDTAHVQLIVPPEIGDLPSEGFISTNKERSSSVAIRTEDASSKSKATRSYLKSSVAEVFDDGYDGGGASLKKTQEMGKAGALTAGELNDFAKWNLWQRITDDGLATYAEKWGMKSANRVSILISNQQDIALTNIKVDLYLKEKKIWTSFTDNAGRAELWLNFYGDSKINLDNAHIEITAGKQHFRIEDLVEIETGTNHIILPVDCHTEYALDIAFVVDATGSMGDEINYLKAELEDVIKHIKQENAQLDVNLGSVFYRDIQDAYLTRISPFSSELENTINFIKEQGAAGGGDFPEAVDTALSLAINSLKWQPESRSKLLFLMLDAPPHKDSASLVRMQKITKQAAQKGIRIIPVVGSGIDKSTEYLMRTLALATNGTYVFLTDHSGIGGTHLAPETDKYDVKLLNELLKEIITRFTTVSECGSKNPENSSSKVIVTEVVDKSLTSQEMTSTLIKNKVISKNGTVHQSGIPSNALPGNGLSYYPNPTTGPLNLRFDNLISDFHLLNVNGKLLKSYPTNGLLSMGIDVSEFPGGIYFVAHQQGEEMKMNKLIIEK